MIYFVFNQPVKKKRERKEKKGKIKAFTNTDFLASTQRKRAVGFRFFMVGILPLKNKRV
jgi:hypothetical protein